MLTFHSQTKQLLLQLAEMLKNVYRQNRHILCLRTTSREHLSSCCVTMYQTSLLSYRDQITIFAKHFESSKTSSPKNLNRNSNLKLAECLQNIFRYN